MIDQAILVRDAMTPNLIQVREDEHIYNAIAIFEERRISGMVVVDKDNKHPVGVLSKTDLASSKLIKYLNEHANIDEAKVSDFMNPGVPLMVNENSSLEEAVNIMTAHHIHRLFVTSDADEMVGILTTFNIIKAVSQSPTV